MSLVSQILGLFAYAFVFFMGAGALAVAVIFVIDKTQTKHAIRRNYPVIGRFRYVFEQIGEFFRQYFFAMDREEMPFNRAERAWVYRSAKGEDNTVPFGSTRDLRPPGTAIFANCPYSILDEETRPTSSVTVGPYSRLPYSTSRFFHISAMSYGAISKPAVLALSNGARKAGCWLNTGEGGLAPYHLAGGADVVFQMGTAKYGVRENDCRLSDTRLRELANYEQVRMIEVKLSQGAKPGKGGILPAAKVTAEVARIRGIPQGQDSISPQPAPGNSRRRHAAGLHREGARCERPPDRFQDRVGLLRLARRPVRGNTPSRHRERPGLHHRGFRRRRHRRGAHDAAG